MRKNKRNNIRRERIIMIASSAFVLAALTMTGVYMKEKNAQPKDDGYTVDFTALEENVNEKYQEIAQNKNKEVADNSNTVKPQINLESDLDYMPMEGEISTEAGSSLVEIPGLTDGMYSQETQDPQIDETKKPADEANALNVEEPNEKKELKDEETAGTGLTISPNLSFSEKDKLVNPTAGEILMHYSMDSSIYFATLDQYKYNPAVMFAVQEGSPVNACAEGKVVKIYNDAQIGHAVVLDLGDGYQATYGQIKDIQVNTGDYVEAGEVIASVAAPTKYFSVEGANLYFQLTKDGSPVNPENRF